MLSASCCSKFSVLQSCLDVAMRLSDEPRLGSQHLLPIADLPQIIG
jgi:hypothetical protein